jgi:hypothetical protein
LGSTWFTTLPAIAISPSVIVSSPRSSAAAWTCRSPRADDHDELAVGDLHVHAVDHLQLAV